MTARRAAADARTVAPAREHFDAPAGRTNVVTPVPTMTRPMVPKGPGDLEDRSHHSKISRRRRREAAAREAFSPLAFDADGNEFIDDADSSDADY